MRTVLFIITFAFPIAVFSSSTIAESKSVEKERITQKITVGDSISAVCVNGERTCQSCTTDVSHTVGGHHFYCSGGQWKSVTPVKCNTASPCKK